jgi:hypothetical protein
MAGTWPVTPMWVQVTDRDQRRCTCTGECGHPHGADTASRRKKNAPVKAPARCQAEAPAGPFTPGTRSLVMAPRNPSVPGDRAWQLPADELATWCTPCLIGASSRAKSAATRAAKKAAKADADQGGDALALF